MKKIEYKWIALSCTTLGALFSVLSGSTLMIALPVIMKDLSAGMEVIMWVLMGYMLSLTILVPSIGRVADIVGRKKLYVGGFAVFTLSSLLCGLSHSGTQLLVFRLIQSVGGAFMVANSTAIVADAFPQNELGKALGINGMIISIASIIGPILGGFLVNYGWRSIFYINIPIGIIGTLWAMFQLKEINSLPEHQKFDWIGTITFSVGILLFLIALSFGGFTGWMNKSIIIMFAVALVFIAAFIYIEGKAEQPMLDLRLFKNGLLASCYGSVFLNGLARGAVTFMLIFYFQGIKAIDPIVAGVLLAPIAISMMIVSPISGWFSDKYGSRGLSFWGLMISAVGLLGFVRISEHSSMTELVIWMLVLGFGSGMFFSPNAGTIMGAVPAYKRGIASGTRTMMINAGSVISIALTMAIISSSISPEAMNGLFVGTQVGSQGIAVNQFIGGLRLTFVISFAFSVLAAFISLYKGVQPEWENS